MLLKRSTEPCGGRGAELVNFQSLKKLAFRGGRSCKGIDLSPRPLITFAISWCPDVIRVPQAMEWLSQSYPTMKKELTRMRMAVMGPSSWLLE